MKKILALVLLLMVFAAPAAFAKPKHTNHHHSKHRQHHHQEHHGHPA